MNGQSDTDMDRVIDEYMMEDMEMGPVISFTRRYKAFSSDQLPESNLRTQIEFGGKRTLLYYIVECNNII